MKFIRQLRKAKNSEHSGAAAACRRHRPTGSTTIPITQPNPANPEQAMFVGHTALALAAKAKAPKLSLGWLVAATFALDLLWPIFLVLGIEQVSIAPGATAFNALVFDSYPWSHSLLMACIWGLSAAGIARWLRLPNAVAVLVGALVVSHWVLDWASHIPDLPLWPGASPLFGLGLWNSVFWTLLVEGALFLAGITIYVRTTRPVDRIGSIGFWSFIVVCAGMWAFSPWSPPPPSPQALAWFSFGSWLLVAWAGWADRHREVNVA